MDVEEEIILKMKEFSKEGGYIVATSHTVMRDVPAENLNAMIKVLTNQQKYIYINGNKDFT